MYVEYIRIIGIYVKGDIVMHISMVEDWAGEEISVGFLCQREGDFLVGGMWTGWCWTCSGR